MKRPKVLFVFGTRPEAIKLCPVILHFRSCADQCETRVCVTGQHRELLDDALAAFAVRPDYDLRTMSPGQSLAVSTARILEGLSPVIEREQPDIVLVQGDTISTLCGALTAYYHRTPSAHVEAGLRTGDRYQPFPEEMNRVLVSRLTALHFAATESAARNLRAEGITADVHVTGNSGIDALLHVQQELAAGRLKAARPAPELDPKKKLILFTAHRRENFGSALESVCRALTRLARRPDVQILAPVHPNPEVRSRVERLLAGTNNVLLTDPADYVSFVDWMRQSYLILTDSGGIQEEAPSLGKPVLVMRDKTERPEAVEAGTAVLTGTDESAIVRETEKLLDDRTEYETRSRRHNPYGDGRASHRIGEATMAWLRGAR
jgi:UDP-N-acetylglucosamine 2-epimerase (non-hydrolysing)